MIHLDYRDARPIYSQIVEGIRSQILAGVLQEGDKLPSVRELATRLTINPNTIQRAYRELEMDGWVVSVPGKGSFVTALSENQTQETQLLLEKFQDTVDALLRLGVSPQTLTQRILKGGNDHA